MGGNCVPGIWTICRRDCTQAHYNSIRVTEINFCVCRIVDSLLSWSPVDCEWEGEKVKESVGGIGQKKRKQNKQVIKLHVLYIPDSDRTDNSYAQNKY